MRRLAVKRQTSQVTKEIQTQLAISLLLMQVKRIDKTGIPSINQ